MTGRPIANALRPQPPITLRPGRATRSPEAGGGAVLGLALGNDDALPPAAKLGTLAASLLAAPARCTILAPTTRGRGAL